MLITSADEAIDQLGGPRRFGKLLKELDGTPVDERTVWNWRRRGFPSHRIPEIQRLLRRRRLQFTHDVFARRGG
jgi:hypothetical protein